MNKDIRVELSFFGHRKTRKLIKKYGLAGPWGLERLWAYAAQYRPSGYLTGMSALDVLEETHMDEYGANDVKPDEYMQFMINDCRWIDDTEKGWYLHDWHIYQSHLKKFSLSKRLCSKTWKKVKEFIFKRDGGVCSYCGA